MPTAKQNRSSTSAVDENKSKGIYHILYGYTLKLYANTKENARSADDIQIYMMQTTGQSMDRKYTKMHLDALVDIQENIDQPENTPEYQMAFALSAAIGGQIKRIPGKPTKYYIDPFINESDLAMLSGSIRSSHFFSLKEQAYLIQCEMLLNPSEQDPGERDDIFQKLLIQGLPVRPAPVVSEHGTQADTILPERSSRMLLHIHALYQAIARNYQVEIIYGEYTAGQVAQTPDRAASLIHPKFEPRKNGAPYFLNPYTLLWNNGRYYLIATSDGSDHPMHFRVDRIISVKPHSIEPDESKKAAKKNSPYKKRDPLPMELKDYFIQEGNKYLFNNHKYTKTNPLMMANFTNKEDLISETLLECTTNTLSVIIDTFGSDIHVCASPLPHENDKDFYGRTPVFLLAKIRNVRYNNMLLFCLQQLATVTTEYPPVFAVYPQQLVDDIDHHLEISRNRYAAFREQGAKTPHPYKIGHSDARMLYEGEG